MLYIGSLDPNELINLFQYLHGDNILKDNIQHISLTGQLLNMERTFIECQD